MTPTTELVGVRQSMTSRASQLIENVLRGQSNDDNNVIIQVASTFDEDNGGDNAEDDDDTTATVVFVSTAAADNNNNDDHKSLVDIYPVHIAFIQTHASH